MTKWQTRKVIAWDGEGANLNTCHYCHTPVIHFDERRWQHIEAVTFKNTNIPYDHEPVPIHVYNLLSNSRGYYILNKNGLATEEVFQFFLSHSERDAINVIYGGSYDVNMFLGDLPADRIERLWNDGHCYWKQYGISYINRKSFSLAIYPNDHPQIHSKPIRTFTLWDVIGYYQRTFVSACEYWLGNDREDIVELYRQIQQMKERRSSFASETIEEVIRYNYFENQLLVLLVQKLFHSLDKADIVLSRYDGAGSIAGALLKRFNIEPHKGTISEDVERWAQYCYSGGRIEATKIGNGETTKVYRYDLNSAYPAVAVTLPSYRDAVWTLEREWNGSPYSMVEVEWDYQEEALFYPLWHRWPNGSIIYPRSGKGRYYGSEIQALSEYYSEGSDFHIISAYNVSIRSDTHPFEQIETLYKIRRKLKDADTMAHEAYKLGLNSIYGKLAQQAGYERYGRIPRYHHLLWAGQITSQTRANLYRAAMQHPTSIIAFATDAIISLKKHKLPVGSRLGEWTPESLDGIVLAQPGVYWLKHNTEWTDKYRGFDKGSLTREAIIRAWEKGKKSYRAELSRFFGMGSAVGLNNFQKYWRVWRTDPRDLEIQPNGKREAGPLTCYHEQLCDTVALENPLAPILSMPYPLAWRTIKPNSIEKKAATGLSIWTVSDEREDGYV